MNSLFSKLLFWTKKNGYSNRKSHIFNGHCSTQGDYLLVDDDDCEHFESIESYDKWPNNEEDDLAGTITYDDITSQTNNNNLNWTFTLNPDYLSLNGGNCLKETTNIESSHKSSLTTTNSNDLIGDKVGKSNEIANETTSTNRSKFKYEPVCYVQYRSRQPELVDNLAHLK